jgi:hypothetical protein
LDFARYPLPDSFVAIGDHEKSGIPAKGRAI